VFGSGFEPAFAFQKAKSQPNTLASQSCFSPKLLVIRYKTESSSPAFTCCGGGQLRKNYPPATFKKLTDFELRPQPTTHNSFFTAHRSQQLFKSHNSTKHTLNLSSVHPAVLLIALGHLLLSYLFA